MDEQLKEVMRRWISGVAVASSRHTGIIHGMTVNSFTSVSLSPPRVTVTMADNTRTLALVKDSGYFGISILARHQDDIAARFAGRNADYADDRFRDLMIFSLVSGVPLLFDSLAQLDCRVVHTYEMEKSTLFVGEVMASHLGGEGQPLMYMNRVFITG